jgi:serine/threonine protein kinase
VGVVHRDVKPANILLTPTDDGLFRGVLLDFGIARSLDPAATISSTGMVVGTPGYIAPEVALGGRTADNRSDLYSLGVVLYEALVGAPPFVAANGMALVVRQSSEDPIAPHVREPGVPAEISSLTMRLMDRDPARRPSSAAATIKAIEALLEGRQSDLATLDGDAVEDESEFFKVTWDPAIHLVRITRTSRPFERAEDTAGIYTVMRTGYPTDSRSDKLLLIDVRFAPARADPRFAKIVAGELPALMSGWRRVASLTASTEGAEQIRAIRRRAGLDAAGVFTSEEEALSYLFATEDGR